MPGRLPCAPRNRPALHSPGSDRPRWRREQFLLSPEYAPGYRVKRDLRLIARLDPLQRPEKWDGPHVQHRFAEAIETLRKLPMGRLRPAEIRSSWPRYALDWNTFMGRMSADITTMAVENKLNQEFVTSYWDWTASQNRWHERPSAPEISAMESALSWPGSYLRGQIELARAFNIVGFAQARAVSVRDVIRGGKHKGVRSSTQWNQMALEAAHAIAVGLRINKVEVF
jgi:hypothetical protein